MPTTLILGASNKPERYANRAQKQLIENGHQVILVNPKGGTIDGIECYKQLSDVSKANGLNKIDTVTLYVNPSIVEQQQQAIAALNPRRVIFNPGSEHQQAAEYFNAKGITTENACTLVLLSMGTY
jgi:hypothetical protein